MRSEAIPAPPRAVNLEPADDHPVAVAIAGELSRAGLPEDLRAIVARVRIADVCDLLSFSSQGYTRRLLASTDDAEVLLLCWLPGQKSAIHGHGQSQGYASILAGRAQEESFRGSGRAATLLSTAECKAGDVLHEGHESIHRVTAGEMLVSLHAYSPRLKDVATYAD